MSTYLDLLNKDILGEISKHMYRYEVIKYPQLFDAQKIKLQTNINFKHEEKNSTTDYYCKDCNNRMLKWIKHDFAMCLPCGKAFVICDNCIKKINITEYTLQSYIIHDCNMNFKVCECEENSLKNAKWIERDDFFFDMDFLKNLMGNNKMFYKGICIHCDKIFEDQINDYFAIFCQSILLDPSNH